MKALLANSILVMVLVAIFAAPGRSAAQGFLLTNDDVLTSADNVQTAAPVKVVVPAQTTEEEAKPAKVTEAAPVDTKTVVTNDPGFLFNGQQITIDDKVVTPAPADTTHTLTGPASGQFQASTNYNIINTNGETICSVPKGQPLTPLALSSTKDYVKVSFSGAPNCGSTGEGWMSINGLQTSNMQIDAASVLSMRSSPGAKDDSNYLCSIARGEKVTVIERIPGNEQYRAWVKVRVANPPAKCPVAEGWVHGEYLRADDAALAGVPVDATAFAEPEETTEAGTLLTCASCMNANVEALKEVVAGTMKLSRLSSWEQNRHLVQIPLGGATGKLGPCGSFHYNPDDSYGTDVFASPITACTLMSIMQEWKRRYPDSGQGSRIQFGDISHKTYRKWNGHKSHTEGNCVDIRPFRTGGFNDSAITHDSAEYSRALTKEFIELAKASGASTVLFNGVKVGATPYKDHDNHLHVCIYDNGTSRRTCDNYKYDAGICGAR